MIDDIKKLMTQYWDWLRDKTTLKQVADYVEISTPFLDRHNDHIQIYAKRIDGAYVLTDDGYTVSDLENSGVQLDSPKRLEILKTTLNGFGVQQEGNAMLVKASPETFAARKHNLIQAMLAVNDLFYLSKPFVASLFLEDVTAWLDQNEIRYTPRVKFTGKSGYDYLFDFVIPKSRRQPERILHTMNRPTHERAKLFAFSWDDTREVRAPDTRAIALLNDEEHTIQSAIIEALNAYGVLPVSWSGRDQIKELLAA
jgi:hypothetical protein